MDQQTHKRGSAQERTFTRVGPVAVRITAPSVCHSFMTEYAIGKERIQILTATSNPDLPEQITIMSSGMVGQHDVAVGEPSRVG